MKIKKAISWLLSLMLAFTMIPAFTAAAYAEESAGSPAISIGAGNIEKGNKVYMGVRYVNENLTPISWLVLGKANSTDLNSNGTSVSPDDAHFLITEKIQYSVQFDMNGQSSMWQGSFLQYWCTQFFLNGSDLDGSQYQNHFSDIEKSAMLSTIKTDAEYSDDNCMCGTSSLNNEQLFPLSAEEASDDYGYFNRNESRIAYEYNNDEAYGWWLRSPEVFTSNSVFFVTNDGSIFSILSSAGFGLRPACNFYLKSVLFTSAATGGKISGTPGADALTAVSSNSTNEWKLTLKDAGRSSFTASAAGGATLEKEEGYSDWSVPVVYSNAKTGDNEYVSVILCDSNGEAKYYGNIANNSAASPDGGQSVNIPAGLAAGSYKIHVFNEQINGDKLTDYASEFSTIELNVTGSVPGGVSGSEPSVSNQNSANATAKIVPKGTSIKKLKKAKRAIKVKWKKQKAKAAKKHISGYQIQLATNKKFTKDKKTVTVKGYKKTTKKVKKLKGGKKYYVRVRTFINIGGVKYYSPWSKVKTVKTKK